MLKILFIELHFDRFGLSEAMLEMENRIFPELGKQRLLDLGVARERVGVLRLQVVVGLLLPLLLHRDWRSRGKRSNGGKQTNTGGQTGNRAPENLALVAWSVQWLSWAPLTEGNVVRSLLLGGGQLLPWQLHSSLQLVYQSSLVLLWQLVPSGLQMVDICVGQGSRGGLGDRGVETDGSGDGLAKHYTEMCFLFIELM